MSVKVEGGHIGPSKKLYKIRYSLNKTIINVVSVNFYVDNIDYYYIG